MAKTTKKELKIIEPSDPKYPKKDILASEQFTKIERDFLSAFLPDGENTIEEAKQTLEKIRKGAVK
ncbi:hypothetical protein [Enterococcus timonensis]|uniref:hypothetical protein n=1 Tax=Enterococcus timonensis TaxID=1852364 RepID=UPI0008DAEF9B|nr:hypothetical protein [Enterococcus timonensis]